MTTRPTRAANSTAYGAARHDSREAPAALGSHGRRDRRAAAERERPGGATFGVRLATARDVLDRLETLAYDCVPSANEPRRGGQRGSMERRTIEPGGSMSGGVT